jgi:lipopolysaccharide heptosyltransferase I
LERPERILIIRPSALGDVCRTVPVLTSLRAWAPGAQIDWMVRAGFEDAIRAHPALSNVIPFHRNRHNRPWIPSHGRALVSWLRELKRARYDLVIDCQGLWRSGFFAWVTGARTRVGFRDARELGWLFLNHRVRTPAGLHAVERMLALLADCDIPLVRDMRLYVPEDALDLPGARLKGARYAVIAPTAIWPSKRWPIERYSELTQRLCESGDIDAAVIVGAPNERDMCAPLLQLSESRDDVIDLVGKTSIAGLMRTIEGSAMVISNDSAAQHMAVGFDRPLVALLGPTGLDQAAYRRRCDVLRHADAPNRYKHKRAGADDAQMRRIEVDEVLVAARDRLHAQRNGPGMNSSRRHAPGVALETGHGDAD